MPQQFQNGWLCKCGMINGEYDSVCKNCHVERDIAEDEGMDELEEYYLEALEGEQAWVVLTTLILGMNVMNVHTQVNAQSTFWK